MTEPRYVTEEEVEAGSWPDDAIVPAFILPDCPDCEEPYCPKHDMHYAECPCKGPHSEDEE